MSSISSRAFRVALFHPALIHGGIQRVFLNLASGFLEHGLAVDLVQATPGGGLQDQVPAGVRVVDLNASRALTSVLPLVRYLRQILSKKVHFLSEKHNFGPQVLVDSRRPSAITASNCPDLGHRNLRAQN